MANLNNGNINQCRYHKKPHEWFHCLSLPFHQSHDSIKQAFLVTLQIISVPVMHNKTYMSYILIWYTTTLLWRHCNGEANHHRLFSIYMQCCDDNYMISFGRNTLFSVTLILSWLNLEPLSGPYYFIWHASIQSKADLRLQWRHPHGRVHLHTYI